MSKFYAACELGAESGRVMLGTLHGQELTISEVCRFENLPLEEKRSLHWNIPQLYRGVISGLRMLGQYDEPLNSISCVSWGGDYLLFGPDGSLITPVFHHQDPRSLEGMKKVLAKIPWDSIYAETGVQAAPGNTLFQLGTEKARHLARAGCLLPVADAFNYLLSGVARVEMSSAGTTQLYNPMTGTWSERLLEVAALPPKLLPIVVRAGTPLGLLRPEVSKDTRLTDARVIAGCSDELASALAGLPVNRDEAYAWLRMGPAALMGSEVPAPLINEAGRDWGFTHQMGWDGAVHFYKQTAGLWILEECHRSWENEGRSLDCDLLTHLAGAVSPFESLINLEDPRFREPGDMPLKIQAYCRETGQEVPHKPGPIFRCVLESLALSYRQTLAEIETLAGKRITRLFIMGGAANNLLTHFTANAIEIPVVLVPRDAVALGNILIQAVAGGHIDSPEHARDLVRSGFPMETIIPRTGVWNAASERFAQLAAG
jgi:rhamnulokinase